MRPILKKISFGRPCRFEKKPWHMWGISTRGRSSFVLKILAIKIEIHANCFSPHAVV